MALAMTPSGPARAGPGAFERAARTCVGLLAVGIALVPSPARADAETHRLQVVEHFAGRFPDIAFADYAQGALVFDVDARLQYDSIMSLRPFAAELDKAALLWRTPLADGTTYADCLPQGGRMIAGHYPRFDDDLGRVVTLEDLVNQCRVKHGERPYSPADADTMGLLMVHLRSLSDGMTMAIRVEGEGAQRAFEDGRRTFYARAGQLNFSCAHCHIDNAGFRLRSEIMSPVLGQAVHWPVFRGGERLFTLQARYRECHELVRHVADEPGSARYNNLEYFHSYLSNGLKLRAAVFRK